jgi:hypothetical protein
MRIWKILNAPFSVWFFPTVIIGSILFWNSDARDCADARDADLLSRLHLALDIGWTGRDFLQAVEAAQNTTALEKAWSLLHDRAQMPLPGFRENREKLFGERIEDLR